MIQQAFELIRNRLNAFLGSVDPGNDGWVVLSNIVDHEGHPFVGAENKIVMFLGNVEYETSMSTQGRTARSMAAPLERRRAALHQRVGDVLRELLQPAVRRRVDMLYRARSVSSSSTRDSRRTRTRRSTRGSRS